MLTLCLSLCSSLNLYCYRIDCSFLLFELYHRICFLLPLALDHFFVNSFSLSHPFLLILHYPILIDLRDFYFLKLFSISDSTSTVVLSNLPSLQAKFSFLHSTFILSIEVMRSFFERQYFHFMFMLQWLPFLLWLTEFIFFLLMKSYDIYSIICPFFASKCQFFSPSSDTTLNTCHQVIILPFHWRHQKCIKSFDKFQKCRHHLWHHFICEY